MSKFKGLFLVITHNYRARVGVNTRQSSWVDDKTNWYADETMEILQRVPHNKMNTATVVINVLENKFVKSRSGDTSEEALDAIVSSYADDIQRAIVAWIKENPDRLQILENKLEQYRSQET